MMIDFRWYATDTIPYTTNTGLFVFFPDKPLFREKSGAAVPGRRRSSDEPGRATGRKA
jgi:hypothetical protein